MKNIKAEIKSLEKKITEQCHKGQQPFASQEQLEELKTLKLSLSEQRHRLLFTK
jgi:hypothetical protein